MIANNIENSNYNLKTYAYNLPETLIAQFPVEPRDSARLLVMNRQTGHLREGIFKDVINYLEPGDTLVLNDTKVLPARLLGSKPSGGRVEIFLLQARADKWEALVKPARRLKRDSRIIMDGDTGVEVIIEEELDFAGGRLISFRNCPDINGYINTYGHMPLPPYINRQDETEDRERYQTVYAREMGSVAAPTAGLHFTEDLLTQIKKRGVNIARVVLHVGLGTFRPVSSMDIRDHHMHFEYYQLDDDTARLLNNTRQQGKKIIAVGTTVVRTLETVYNNDRGFYAKSGETNKFIYPGYEYQAIDGLITNFHLPESSLIMLVAAFAGIENTKSAYNYAVQKEFRFFSYGDAMLII